MAGDNWNAHAMRPRGHLRRPGKPKPRLTVPTRPTLVTVLLAVALRIGQSCGNSPAAPETIDPLAQLGKDCGIVRESEYADGAQSRTPIEKLRAFNMPGVWVRPYEGATATISYFCNSPHVDGILVIWQFAGMDAAKVAYARQLRALTRRFGSPCWNSDNLDADTRARLKEIAQALPDAWADRVDWNVRPQSVATLHHSKFDGEPRAYVITVGLNSPAMYGHAKQTDIGWELYHAKCWGYRDQGEHTKDSEN
jgi:hypothetical protein